MEWPLLEVVRNDKQFSSQFPDLSEAQRKPSGQTFAAVELVDQIHEITWQVCMCKS